MKKAVYIITALLMTAFTVYCVLDTITSIGRYHGLFFGSDKAFFVQSIVTSFVMITTYLAFVVLSLMQIKKPTPRIILMFSGAAFFTSLNSIVIFTWWGFLCMTAGLLPALYEFIRYGKLVKKAPRQCQSHDRMLIAAGVAACLWIVYVIYYVAKIILIDIRIGGFDNPLLSYFPSVNRILQTICIAVFCFLRYRRTGLLYRMFFIGSSVVGVLVILAEIASRIIIKSELGFYSTTLNPISTMLSLALVLLVFIHTFKTRRNSLIPQEHAEIAPQADMPAP